MTAGLRTGMSRAATRTVGRFAPSPTGPLHAGSMVAALASWLDARARGGSWIVRIEDTDVPRCDAKYGHLILQQLSACGLHSDAPVVWQSRRHDLYQSVLDQLFAARKAYPCRCSRLQITQHWQSAGQIWGRHQEVPYPGTCRSGLGEKTPRSIRFLTQGAGVVKWNDRRLSSQAQDVERFAGDFVLRRADGLWSYQLAVVADDASQGVTHVVRGEDLADNTARQILLQRALGYEIPEYLHTPIVRDSYGEKLSKQTGAPPIDTTNPMQVIHQAGATLGLDPDQTNLADQLATWVNAWRQLWPSSTRS